MNKVPITLRGAEQLRAELKNLKTKDRPRIIAAISEARSHGDLKENAEYHAAKEQQGFCEGRIQEVEAKLANAQIIDVTALKPTGKVVFGTTVQLIAEGSGDGIIYQIVGDDEADIKAGRISVSSPIARALIGKQEGDLVKVTAPGGVTQYEIVDVKYI